MTSSVLRLVVLSGAVGVLGLFSTNAQANPQPAITGEVAKRSETKQVFSDFAQCLYASNPNLVFRWLRTLPGSSDEKLIVSSMMYSSVSCLMNNYHDDADSVKLSFRNYQLRLALAEVAVLRLSSSLPHTRPESMTDKPWFSDITLTDEYRKSVASMNSLAGLNFGHCVAYSAWPETINFLRSRPGSDSNSALSTLKPALGPCLPAGSELAVTPSSLRSLLSEAVWHVVARPSVRKSGGAV